MISHHETITNLAMILVSIAMEIDDFLRNGSRGSAKFVCFRKHANADFEITKMR